jgi:hypothetical protein
VVALAVVCIPLERGGMWDFICSFICHEQSFEESDVVPVLIYEELFPLQKKKKVMPSAV